jgi:hypothetical protein
MFNQKLLITLSMLIIMGGLISCGKDEDKKIVPAAVMVDMPELTARCKYTNPSAGYCDGTEHNSGGMTTNKGIVYIVDSGEELVGMQLGDLICGDGGAVSGVHCFMSTSTASWIDADGNALSQIPAGTYMLIFNLDKNGDVASYSDLDNFGAGDTACSATVTVAADTTEITDADATLFTCTTIPLA